MNPTSNELGYRLRFVKKINGRGTVTVPREVYEALGLTAGDLLEIQVVRVLRPAQGTMPAGGDAPRAAVVELFGSTPN